MGYWHLVLNFIEVTAVDLISRTSGIFSWPESPEVTRYLDRNL